MGLLELGIIFALLILIIQLIFVYKVYPRRKENQSSLQEPLHNSRRDSLMEEGSNQLIHDEELVAVITAAIYASMGADMPKDGFVVRSIRKINITYR